MSDLPIRVYTSDSALRKPTALLREMLHDLMASRELAVRIFIRDVSAQYRQSILGYLWVFIPPLVAGLPFVYLSSQGILTVGDTPVPYAAYALIGTTIWQVFVDALNAPLKAINGARTVVTRINVPREGFLLAGLGQVILGFLARLVLVVGVLALFRLTPPAAAPLFLVGVMAIILAGFAIGLMLTPLGMLYTDVQRAIPIVTVFMMLLTPVVYPVPKSGLAAIIAKINPLTPLIAASRDWLTVGSTAYVLPFIGVTLLALLALFVGWVLFRVAMPHLIERMGN